jgi:hypothetical protein
VRTGAEPRVCRWCPSIVGWCFASWHVHIEERAVFGVFSPVVGCDIGVGNELEIASVTSLLTCGRKGLESLAVVSVQVVTPPTAMT